jgi:hypothetical protein
MIENREPAILDAEARFLETKADEFVRRAKDLRDTAHTIVREEKAARKDLEARLESQDWIPAKSGKCDFVRDAPAELVEAVRGARGGVRGTGHHFTASSTEPTLFRFKRSSKA